MSQPAFKHQPLADPARQIRLIEVISQPDMPLELSLSAHRITQSPGYYAISYTWGDGGFTDEIAINGQSMMVTENCRYALTQVSDRYPSLPGKAVFIWIDSICINQADNDEKSFQVAMMGNIYTKASQVLACVGPHRDNSQMIRNVLDSFMPLISLELGCHWEEYSLSELKSLFGPESDPQSKTAKLLRLFFQNLSISSHDFCIQFSEAFSAFVDRSYWGRVWIIQEVVAATRSDGQLQVLCGCDAFSKIELLLCNLICRRLPKAQEVQRSSTGRGSYCFNFVLNLHLRMPIPATALLGRTQFFRCARPEDRVYGLLSLIEWPDGTTPVRPCYEPSAVLDLAQLFTGFMGSGWNFDSRLTASLDALEIYHDHKLLRPLIEARMRSPPEPLGHGKYQPVSVRFGAIMATIYLNDHGQISANLVRKMNRKRAELEGALEGSKQLFAGSEVGALLCSDVQVGDKITEVRELGKLLVLRCSQREDEYDIVGQGLLASDHTILSYTPGYLARGKQRVTNAYIKGTYSCFCELQAEPIDLIVLERQDRGAGYSRIEEKTWERLSTKIYGRVKCIE
ncbi:hypothetical protein QSH57_011584 [Fusarium oxysporum f. sp. vasinfectum]|nr:hypothetical protein QSH57_011584 [Fusarium oxysporum f. sp. vasinfectum]